MPAKLRKERPIASDPWIVQTIDAEATAFLDGLPAPDFTAVSDPQADWACPANDADEGSVYGSALGGGTAATYVVSAHTHRRLKAHRF